MKHNRYFLAVALLMAGIMPSFSQISNDNEDEVFKIDSRVSQNDFVPGQILLKFKDENQIKVARTRGAFNSVDNNAVNAVLKEFGVKKMDKLLSNENPKRKLSKTRAFNGQMIEEHDLSQLYLVEVDETHIHQAMQLAEELKKQDAVEYAEPNYKVYLMDANIAASFGGNPFTTQQWYLDDYGVKQLWNKPIVNPQRPVIAILDTGVDMTHPDLKDNLWTNTAEAEGESGYDNDGNGFPSDVHGWDFINNTPNVKDFNMHGTHVAGIAAAANNGIGIIGANPMALIMPISVMQSDGTGDVATIVKGIDYAVANGATVLNLSLGTYANSRALRQALEKAYQSAVIVSSAGNDGRCINSPHHPRPCYGAAPMFPAAYSFVLGVQATTNTGGLAGFSNYDDDGNTFSTVTTFQDPDGFNYELKAPGTNMLSTIPGGKYKALNGTSMAAPLVAGAISALKMVKQYDTQEILWGDLLHTNNIAQAYTVTARPAELDLMKIMYRERKELTDVTEEDYSNDGEIDAGETISLYPVIRTTFGAASNIKMKLEMGDEFEDPNTVEILTPGWVDFGLHLDAYGKGVSLNPMQLKVADNVADNRHIKMKFTAKCDETNTLYEGHFTIIVNNMVKINGLISEDRTLTADHIYYVNENLGIMEGVTLTIEPGTRLEFAEGMGLSSFGKLVADGTPEKPIVFTGHYDEVWAGINSHGPTGELRSGSEIYTNSDQTLFTLLPTNQTPFKQESNIFKYFYHKAGEAVKHFNLQDYITIPEDMTAQQDLLTDPAYLTPALSKLLSDYNDYCAQFPLTPTEQETEYTYSFAVINSPWHVYANPRDTISYCIIEKFGTGIGGNYYPYMKDCQIHPSNTSDNYFVTWNLDGERINLTDCNGDIAIAGDLKMKQSNVINNFWGHAYDGRNYTKFASLNGNNYFNNFTICNLQGKYYGKMYSLGSESSTPIVDHATNPSYLGSSREEIIRPLVYELGNAPNTYSSTDLSNMRITPISEAHGVVWKVVVNGKDAQDEYEDLAPLGVGKHKFEVYFNRPMNKAVAPQISFGVREPYTQNAVTEDGSWNEEGTIYTAYKTITGKTKSDGVNRIYVYGAEDNEFFEIPYEKTRFNFMINAAGSMATGFAAEAGMGRVDLTWDNTNNNFEDAMGFNIYRYTLDSEGNEQDNTRINTDIVDIETTEYTDYDVTPGTTYYYMYKVLSTDLQEYDVSNVVAVTPLTATRGDANGDSDVDVQDVITTVNYAAGMDPKPFIFEAADMNTDLTIDILDVIGIIQGILNPSLLTASSAEATAIYTIEDGTLYVESPVALAGVQVELAIRDGQEIIVAKDLDGFEHTSTLLSDNDYRFFAYNMSGKTLSAGKHALLHINDAEILNICLGDIVGHKVSTIGGDGGTTGIDRVGKDVMNVKGVYNLKGQKITGSANQLKNLPKGVYIIDGIKVVK